MAYGEGSNEMELARERRAEDGLIDAAIGGDVRAFEQLYRRYSARVMGLCLRMTRQHALAEDCVQATFINAWRNLASFQRRSSFGTWLHRIAVNQVLTHARQCAARPSLVTDMADEQQLQFEPPAEDAGTVMDMERALAGLPEGARHVLVLQAIYGYSHEEVSQMLGIAVGTCKAQLHRGRQLLKQRLGWEGVQ